MEYIICFCISSTLLYSASKDYERARGKIIGLLAALMPIIMATVRSTKVGIDVTVYIQPYAMWAINADSFMSYIAYTLANGVEIGYSILNYIGANYFGGLPGVFFLSSLLTIVPVYSRLMDFRDEIPVWVPSLIFLLLFYNLSLNLARQAIALSILFFAVKYIDSDQYVKFIIFMIVAFTFHSSALLGVIYLALVKISKGKDWKIKQLLTIAVLLGMVISYKWIFSIVIQTLFSSNADKYIRTFLPDESGYLSLWMLLVNAFAIMCVIFNKPYLSSVNKYRVYLLMMVFNFVLYLLNQYNGNCFRYALYFMIMIPQIVPLIRYRFSKNSRFCADLMLVGIFLLYWMNFNLLSDSYGTIPYSMM